MSIIFAKDFPVNLDPLEFETDSDVKAGSQALESKLSTGPTANKEGQSQSMLMQEGAAQILASSTNSAQELSATSSILQKRINNNKASAKPDTRLSRDALPGEIKFKQIKLTNKNTNFEVSLLVRKQ